MELKYIVYGIVNLIYILPVICSLSFPSKLEEYVLRDLVDIILNSNPQGKSGSKCNLPYGKDGRSMGPSYMRVQHGTGGGSFVDEYTISLVSTITNETDTRDESHKSQHLDTNKDSLVTGILSPDVTTRDHSVCRANSTHTEDANKFGPDSEVTANLMVMQPLINVSTDSAAVLET